MSTRKSSKILTIVIINLESGIKKSFSNNKFKFRKNTDFIPEYD
jgi:hypothetical protein